LNVTTEVIKMKNTIAIKTKREGKRYMAGWIITFIIIAVAGAGGAAGWSRLAREHDEARNLPINAVDFSTLHDGTYTGEYEGGMYKWRANKVQVTVASGKVSDIKLVRSSDPGKENTQQNMLYKSVIEAQSLQVDAISGATLTSKAYLKAVEDALVKAAERLKK
jgi:uncharacterized protein with FMN-binding domain